MNFDKYSLYQNINFSSNVFRDLKQKLLIDFCNTWKHLPEQGSIEWSNARQMSVAIGGSDMGSVMGLNKYTKYKDWIASKVGLTKFNGNIYTRWGKLFEHISTRTTEMMLKMDSSIFETGSIPCYARKGIKYSPDGLGIVKLKCSGAINDKVLNTEEYLYVLFEFKSPFSTIPDGHIPPHYVPQALTGMCSLPHIDVALFINNLYRKCGLSDFNYSPKYDDSFHKTDKSRNFKAVNPIAMGVIYFYQTPNQKTRFNEYHGYIDRNDIDNNDNNNDNNDNNNDDDDNNNDDDNNDDDDDIGDAMDEMDIAPVYKNQDLPEQIRYIKSPIDFGCANYYVIASLLCLVEKKFISVYYDEPYIIPNELSQISFLVAQSLTDDNKNIDQINEEIKNIQKINQSQMFMKASDKFIGFLPWKLLKSDIIPQIKDPQFLEDRKADIDKALDIIQKITDNADITTRQQRYNELFSCDMQNDSDLYSFD